MQSPRELLNSHTCTFISLATNPLSLVPYIGPISGLLSKGEYYDRKSNDLVAGAVGQTAEKTAALLEETKGSVLLIDEAYSLNPSDGADGGSTGARAFNVEAIDALVAGMGAGPGTDRCIIMAGYREGRRSLDALFKGRNRVSSIQRRSCHELK